MVEPNVSNESCLNGIFCIICVAIMSNSLESASHSEGGKCCNFFFYVLVFFNNSISFRRSDDEKRREEWKRIHDKDKYRRMTDSPPYLVCRLWCVYAFFVFFFRILYVDLCLCSVFVQRDRSISRLIHIFTFCSVSFLFFFLYFSA